MRRTLSALVVTILTVTPSAYALDPGKAISQYVRLRWDSDAGLPQNSVTAVTQTRDGYIWFGTQEGLVRFDGLRFTIYDKGRESSFATNHVSALVEDRDGVLWIGFNDGGVVRLAGGRFTRLDVPFGRSVSAIAQGTNGEMWIGTREDGVTMFRDGAIARNLTTQDGLPSDLVRAVMRDKDALWVATDGIVKIVNDRVVPGLHESCPANVESRLLLKDAHGNLWMNGNRGLTRMTPEGACSTFTADDGLGNDSPLSLLEDREGNLWVGTNGGGLSRFSDGRFTAYTMAHGMSHNVALSVLEDRRGNVWIGTPGSLNRLANGVVTSLADREPLNRRVRAIHENRDGALWISAAGGGFNRVHNGAVTHYHSQIGLFDDKIHHILEDDRGLMWMSTDRGVFHVSRQELIEYAEASAPASPAPPTAGPTA